MKLTGVLAKPNAAPRVIEFELNSYEDLYPVLDCDCFDIAVRRFGKNYYDIYTDDEGLLHFKDPAIYVFDDDYMVQVLVGNCFVCKHNDEGDTISLTDEEIAEVLNNTRQGVLCCEL